MYRLAIAAVLVFTGCNKEIQTKNYLSYKYVKCECDGDAKIFFKEGLYQCECGKIPPAKNARIIKDKTIECPTVITEIFMSKEFNSPITLCKGRFLNLGEKTKIIRVNK